MKVYIVNSSWDYERMWMSNGHLVVSAIELADIVQFTGGADVSPSLYGEANVRSHCDANRDKYEQKIFNHCRELGKPMVGICRGGQFLNVMNGGKMWQHVNNHAIGGTHGVYDYETGNVYECTSTHHQMMIAANSGDVRLVGASKEDRSTLFISDSGEYNREDVTEDTEVLYYPKTKTLCFQPHPEFGPGECEDYFFLLINRYYGDL